MMIGPNQFSDIGFNEVAAEKAANNNRPGIGPNYPRVAGEKLRRTRRKDGKSGKYPMPELQ